MSRVARSRSIIVVAASLPVLAASLASAQVVDGQRSTGTFAHGEYPFRLATQTTATGFGDNFSQLDAIYVNVLADGSLATMITGNLEGNGNGLVTLLDTGKEGAISATNSGGYGVINHNLFGRYTNSFGTRDGTAPGSVFSPGFNPRYAHQVNAFGGKIYQDMVNLSPSFTNDYYLGEALYREKTSFVPSDPPAPATTLNYSFNNTSGNTDSNITTALDDNNTLTFSANSPELATLGLEVQYSAAFLRQKPGTQTKLLVYLAGGDSYFLSNQFLPGLPSGTGNLAGTDNSTPRFNVETQTSNPLSFYLIVPTPTSTSADHSWLDDASWTTGHAPNGTNTQAAFDAGTSPKSVYLNGNVTTGTIYLSGTGGVTINGNGGSGGSDLIMRAFEGDTTVIRASSGSHTINQAVRLGSNLSAEVSAGSSIHFIRIQSEDTTTRATGLSVSGGGTVVLDSYAGGPVSVSGALLDLQGQAVVTGQTEASLSSLVASWWNSGARNGSGLGSSLATLDTITTIGVTANNDGTGNPFHSSFAGVDVSTGDTLAMYTYIGDTDLSGDVDSTDLQRLIVGIRSNGTLTGWSNGDTNYDGLINGNDLANLLLALRLQGAPFSYSFPSGVAGGGAVPEPSTLAAALPLLAIGLRRRR